jgi:hypothetical protein
MCHQDNDILSYVCLLDLVNEVTMIEKVNELDALMLNGTLPFLG